MKIIMFVSNPFTNDPRVYNEAKSLIKAGHEVTVIAWDRDKQSIPQEIWDGIHVIRLQTKFHTNHSRFNWLWVGFGLLLWQRKAFKQALTLHDKIRFDVIHCHDFDTLLTGIKFKKASGLPLVYDAHEIYGYMITATLPKFIANVFLWIERRLLKYVNHMINVAEPQKKYYSALTKTPISIVMNCKPALSSEYQPTENQGIFNILYIGGLHPGRPIPMLIE